MAELVTGHAGKAHATAEQAAGLNAGILGLDDYVLNVHDKFKITVVSANKVTIGTGELVMQGRHVSQGTPEDLIITNGSQGMKRNDLVVCRYTKGSQSIESARLLVVKGTPTTGTPTDPALNTTSPLDGGTTYDMPLYRIPLDGIAIGTPVALFNVLKPMSDVWDSLTLTKPNANWNVDYRTAFVGGMLIVAFHAIRVNTDWAAPRIWDTSKLFRLPTGLEAAFEVHCATVSNSSMGLHGVEVQTAGNEISLRSAAKMTLGKGGWVEGCITVPLDR